MKRIEKKEDETRDHPTAVLWERMRRVKSVELFAGRRELFIEHAGEVYLLRHTSKGKLILTK
ncbi:MAG: hemin uptake protein HemP [Burkholderiales bacterium]